MRAELATLEEFKEYLRYDRKSGKLFIKKHKKYCIKKVGAEAGHINGYGYVQFSFNYKIYSLHRVVWFFEKGIWPKIIDHIDGDRSNNKISNLREVTTKENLRNTKKHRMGRLVGTYWSGKAWISQIREDETMKYLGSYKTEEEAHLVFSIYEETMGRGNERIC